MKRKRLDPHRFDGLPLARPVRLVDEAVLERARRRGFCEVCKVARERCEAHHISSRGAFGDDTQDNVVAVCRLCHVRIHAGLISRDDLREIVNARYRS